MTGSPDIAARIIPTANPNTVTNVYNQFNVNDFALPAPGGVGTGSLTYLRTPGTFSNDITLTKQMPIWEKYSVEIRVSVFNLFNSTRYQDINTSLAYKMNGATFASGTTLINTPQALLNTYLASTPGANAQAQFNQYRTGVGSTNLTSELDPRRLELALRFKF